MSNAMKISPRFPASSALGAVAMLAMLFAASALSNPTNPVVVSGSASFNQAGKVLTVTNSNGAIINWDRFSIQAGETTRFAQPSAASAVLNRVLNDPTAIYGTLSSNGRVWLVNPAGILVGPGGRVDTAGFLASTLGVSTQDFLAGRKLFEGPPGAGNVVNQGEIRTPAGGSVYLIGSNVTNEGIITTPKGETILAAGAKVSLIDSATPGVKVEITGSAGNSTNLGEITAEAGRVGIAGVIVKNSGKLNASSVVSEGGRVFLKASQDAYVDGDSRVTATGTRGGKVEVLGNRVAVTDRALIDASGIKGGGSILVGGDYQGRNPAIPNAQVSYFGKDATLKADATGAGKGGKVIVWADDTTRAYGSIFARGGARGGNGGFVETSGHYLEARGRVDVSAPKGRMGSWLLDPASIVITGGVGEGAADGSAVFAGSPGGVPGQIAFFDGSPTVVFQSEIESQSSTANIILEATDAISATGSFTGSVVTLAPNSHLTLRTRNQSTPDLATGINLTGSSNGVGLEFKTQGTGSITLLTGVGGTGPYHLAPISIPKLTTAGGAILVAATGTVNVNGAITTAGGPIDLSGNNLTLAAPASLSAPGGTINLASTGLNANTSIPAGVSVSGGVVNIKTDKLDITGSVTASNSVTVTRYNPSIELQVGGIGSDSDGFLNIRQTEIDAITSPVYRFGDTTSLGGLRVFGPLTIPATKTLSLRTSNLGGSQIVQDPGAIITADFLRAEGGGGVTLTDVGGNVIGALSGKTLSGDFRIKNAAPLNLAMVDGLSGIDAGANNVWLETIGTLNNSAGAATITANGLKVVASGNAALPGPNMVNLLAADMIAGSGSLMFNNGQALTIGTVDVVNGIQFGSNASPINISTTIGNLTVAQPISSYSVATTLSAANALVLNAGVAMNDAVAGQMTKLMAGAGGISGNAAGVILGGGLEVVSGGSVNLTSAAHNVASLAGNVTGSGFSFVNSNNFAVGIVGSTTGLTVNNGDIALTASGLNRLLTVSSNVQAPAGNVTYIADNFTAAASTTTSGSAGKFAEVKPYTATTAIQFSPSVDIAGTLRLNGTELSLFSTPTLKVGNVSQTAGILVNDMVSSGSFPTLSLITGGQITQNAGKTISIPNLNADGFTGVNLPEGNNVGTLAGHTNTGNFIFASANNLNLGTVDINNGITVSTSGSISLTSSGGAISQDPSAILSTPAGTLTANASTGITLSTPTNSVSGVVSLTSAAGNVAYNASGNIQLGVVSTPAAVMIVSGGGAINDGNAATLNLSGSQIVLNAASGIGSGGDPIEVSPTVRIDAQSAAGGIHLASVGTLPVGTVTTPATVSLQSTGGAITDANGPSPNIVANTASLSGYSGVGSGDALETQVTILSASNAMVNAIEVNNVGPLTINAMTNSAPGGAIVIDNVGGITTTGAIFSTVGNVTLTAHSPLTVGAGGITNAANITLTAGSPYVAGQTGDDLTIDGPLTLNGAGTITLNAGNIIGGSQVPVSGGGTVVVSNPNLNTPVPTLAQCIANPLTAGCASVLPTLATCTATPSTPGCSVVLPTLATCTATPSTPGCTVVLPTLATCTATPATPGCTAVLPTLATCTATPTTPGCTAVLPTLATCTATPTTPGCTAVLPTLATCTAAPTTPGCSAVIPSLATCTATPTTPGCSLVLPSLATCTAAPSTAGCSAVLPSVDICEAVPSTQGCSAVLPTLAICLSAPSTPGCSVVLPSLASCTANPATPGCSAVLPTLASCVADPSQSGCTAVLPTVATCAADSSLPGCSSVLPTLASCAANSTLPGCSAVLPSVATCTANPGAEGCTAVLPSLATCSTNPLLAGCSAVLPTLASCTTNSSQPGCAATLSVATKTNTTTTTNDVQTATDSAKNLSKDSSTTTDASRKLALLDTGSKSDSGDQLLGTFGDAPGGTGTGSGSGDSGSGSGDSGASSSGSSGSSGGSSGDAAAKGDEKDDGSKDSKKDDEKAKKKSTGKGDKKDEKKVAVKKIYCN